MSLIAWWPLSDGSLKNLVDGSNPLVTNGNITNSTIGKIGANSYSNSSLANGLGLSSTKLMTLQNTQSMFCWIYVKSHEWLSGICNHHYYTNPSGMGLNMNASGQIAVSTASTKTCTGADSVNGKYRTYFKYCSEGTVPINTWCHVGYVFDRGKLSLYINGARQKIIYAGTNTGVYDYSNEHLQSMIFADTQIRIFNWSGAHDGYSMLGNICDVRIYDHALSVKEVKELSKALVLHYTFDNENIGDGSGYRLSSDISYSNTSIVTSAAIGTGSLQCGGSTSVITNLTGDITQGTTISCWVKGAVPTDSRLIFADYNSKTAFGFFNNGQAIITCAGYGHACVSNVKSSWINDDWNHIVVRRSNGGVVSCWINGVNQTLSSSQEWTHSENKFSVGCRYSGGWTSYFTGLIDDVRVYLTYLSDIDIQELYTAHWASNKQAQVFINSIQEINNEVSHKSNTGIQIINYLSEVIELSDGSCWLQVQHHNNKSGTNLFSSTDAFETKFVYHNDECWSAFPLIKEYGYFNSRYEFMALDQSINNYLTIRRWAQSTNPFTATEAQSHPGAGNRTIIANYSSGDGCLYKYSNSNSSGRSFFVIANGTNTNWYGAFGCFTKWNNNIPSFYGQGVIGVLDLYIRVSPENAKKYREFKNGIVMTTTFNEV